MTWCVIFTCVHLVRVGCDRGICVRIPTVVYCIYVSLCCLCLRSHLILICLVVGKWAMDSLSCTAPCPDSMLGSVSCSPWIFNFSSYTISFLNTDAMRKRPYQMRSGFKIGIMLLLSISAANVELRDLYLPLKINKNIICCHVSSGLIKQHSWIGVERQTVAVHLYCWDRLLRAMTTAQER